MFDSRILSRIRCPCEFIGGLDVNGDGQIDLKGVSDIRIGFKTYSYGGK